MNKKRTKIEELQETINDLERQLDELQIYALSAKRAHATLARGIKKALRLDHWPDFNKKYPAGPKLFADCVAVFLSEEMDKLRAATRRSRKK